MEGKLVDGPGPRPVASLGLPRRPAPDHAGDETDIGATAIDHANGRYRAGQDLRVAPLNGPRETPIK